MENKTTNKKANPVLYALPRLGTSIFIGFADFALLFLYKEAYALPGLFVGLGLAGGKISIAFFQFFFGWISDHTYTKWGRRKPYIFILAPILAISFILLLLPGLILGSEATDFQLFIWFLILNIVFNASYGITTPYSSWTAELFTYEERPKTSAYLNVFNIIGNGLMGVFSLIILTDAKDKLRLDPSNIPPELFYPTIIAGILLVVIFYIVGIVTPTESTPKYESTMIDDLKRVFKNKNYLLVCGMQGIASIAWSIIGSQLLVILENVFALETWEYAIVAGSMLILTIIGIALWKKQVDKIGRKASLIRIFIFAIIFSPFTLLGLIQTQLYLLIAIFIISTITIGLGGWFLFPYMIYSDIAEADAEINGELKAGSYIGFSSIPLNIFQAIGLLISPLILEMNIIYNFKAGADSIGMVLWGPFCSIVLIFALFYTKRLIKLDFFKRKE